MMRVSGTWGDRLCDPKVVRVNSSLELTVSLPPKVKPTVTRAVAVARSLLSDSNLGEGAPGSNHSVPSRFHVSGDRLQTTPAPRAGFPRGAVRGF
jgi:hypothetical protein